MCHFSYFFGCSSIGCWSVSVSLSIDEVIYWVQSQTKQKGGKTLSPWKIPRSIFTSGLQYTWAPGHPTIHSAHHSPLLPPILSLLLRSLIINQDVDRKKGGRGWGGPKDLGGPAAVRSQDLCKDPIGATRCDSKRYFSSYSSLLLFFKGLLSKVCHAGRIGNAVSSSGAALSAWAHYHEPEAWKWIPRYLTKQNFKRSAASHVLYQICNVMISLHPQSLLLSLSSLFSFSTFHSCHPTVFIKPSTFIVDKHFASPFVDFASLFVIIMTREPIPPFSIETMPHYSWVLLFADFPGTYPSRIAGSKG
uniref:uncharacterized protein n=1 Tax=Myxine glutinosa TaxID=7769 RepID=UPI0035900FA1